MPGLLGRIFEITPENLFSLVKNILECTDFFPAARFEGHLYFCVWGEELSIRQGHDACEVFLFDKRIGMVKAYPLNSLKTRVEFFLEPYQASDASGVILMKKLAETIKRIIPNEKIKNEAEQDQITNEQPNPETIERRKKVMELTKAGWKVSRIASELLVSQATIKRDRNALGIAKKRKII